MVTFEWKLPVYKIIGPTFLHLSLVNLAVASLSNGRAPGSFSRCSHSVRQQEVFEEKEDASVFFKRGLK